MSAAGTIGGNHGQMILHVSHDLGSESDLSLRRRVRRGQPDPGISIFAGDSALPSRPVMYPE
jgi:hypothetical protein